MRLHKVALSSADDAGTLLPFRLFFHLCCRHGVLGLVPVLPCRFSGTDATPAMSCGVWETQWSSSSLRATRINRVSRARVNRRGVPTPIGKLSLWHHSSGRDHSIAPIHITSPLWPKETFEALQSLRLPTVRGNHDRWIEEFPENKLSSAGRFARNALTSEQRQTLHNLPSRINLGDGILACRRPPV